MHTYSMLNHQLAGAPRRRGTTGLLGSAAQGLPAGLLHTVAPDAGQIGHAPLAAESTGKKGLFSGMGTKEWIGLGLGSVGDAVSRANGGEGWAVPQFISELRASRLAEDEEAKRARLIGALRRERFSAPQIEIALTNPEALGANYNERFGTRSVADGTHVVTGGPAGPESTFYRRDVPDFEQYAETMNLKPGSEEYFRAVEDYVLRANGPTAFERDQDLDTFRTDNDVRLEGVRQDNRTTLEGLRQRNRVGLRQIPQAPRARGGILGRGAPSPDAPKLPTATGANGEKIKWDGRKWVPVR